jgi:hypothetical protein
MKGTIVCCLRELVTEKFGADKWEKSLTDLGLDKKQMFTALQDVDDAVVMNVIQSVCKTTGITLLQAADAFGFYWVNVYSSRLYNPYYTKHKTSKNFLLAMDDLHVQMTRSMANAKPPRFDYEWKNDKTLLMHYKSHRGLMDFMIGLAKGVGKFYNENIQVTKVNSEFLQIVFP